MKKFIAILLTFLYLGFITGTLVRANLDTLSYETLMDGRGNEKNESETSKGVETIHIHQATKSWSRLRVQNNAGQSTVDKLAFYKIFSEKRGLASHNNAAFIDDPIFLKNRVFRL